MGATIQPMRLSVQSWAKFQHYRNRTPPWLKLHREVVLDNPAWHRLPDASKALAPSLWLLASEFEGGVIVYSIADLAFRLRMSDAAIEGALRPLISEGFFALMSDESATLASRQHGAGAEGEDTKVESKEEGVGAQARNRAKGSQLPKDWQPTSEQLTYAKAQGCADPADTAERFKLHHTSKGTIGKDWNAGFQYWCRNEKNFVRKPAQSFAQQREQAAATVANMDGDDQWRVRVKGWKPGKWWNTGPWGPAPGQPGCRVPPHILAEAGTP